MDKRVTTSGYIVAWVVAVIAVLFLIRTTNPADEWFLAGVASIVMLVLWIGALIALGRRRAWGWFAAVLVLQLMGLGIIGMAGYAIAGPSDRPVPSVTRPSFT